MKLGSEAHKKLFCRSFVDTHLDYDPETLPWPELEDLYLERLRGIPFWPQALATEQRAGKMVTAFAETVSDPVLRDAIALQGNEETRHGRLIGTLIRVYDIDIIEQPLTPIPEQIDTSFKDFGFEECLDSFFAFGLFAIAQEESFFPDSIFQIFDPLLNEEARLFRQLVYLSANSGWSAGEPAPSLGHPAALQRCAGQPDLDVPFLRR